MRLVSVSLIVWAVLVSAIAASAEQVELCMKLNLRNAASETQVGTASCDLTQNLSYEDQTSLWKCSFGGADRKVLTTSAQTVGYNYDNQTSYAGFSVTPATALGKFLLPNLGLATATVGGQFKIWFDDGQPFTTEPKIAIQGIAGSVYELQVDDLRYGRCQ